MELKMKTLMFIVVAAAVFSVVVPQTALAIGTEAGTTISNLASVAYSVGGIGQEAIESAPGLGNSIPGVGAGTATTFLVDNKVNLVTAEVQGAPTLASPGETAAVFAFNVANTGNTTQDYQVVASNFAVGNTVNLGVLQTDDLDVTITDVAIDTNGDNVFNAGDTVTAGNTAVISNLQPSTAGTDGNITVFVLATVPISAIDGSVAVVGLNATTYDAGGGALTTADTAAAWDTTTVQVVFADGAGSDDGSLDGQYSARGAYLVASAILTVTKTADVISDPFTTSGNFKAIPGAVVEYTITITNTGATDATSVTITDSIPVNTAYDPGTLTLNAGGLTDAPADDAGEVVAGVVTVRAGTIVNTVGTATITFRAVIQ